MGASVAPSGWPYVGIKTEIYILYNFKKVNIHYI